MVLLAFEITAQEDLEDGHKSDWSVFDFNASAQIWFRYTDLNPGSAVDGEQRSELYDVSLRRYRLGVTTLLNDHWYFKLNFGENNWNRANSLKFSWLDGYFAYVFGEHLRIGFGKTTNTGLSRFAGPGTNSQVGSDIPLVLLPTVNETDDLTRRYALFVKGRSQKIEYRVAIARVILLASDYSYSETTGFIGNKSDPQLSGYVRYQFFDNESTESDLGAGTYYGTKKVLAVGAGFMFQNNALGRLENSQEEEFDLNHWAVDAFLEWPFDASHSLSSYVGFFNYDYGPDYIRNIGANNPINEGVPTSFNGLGHSAPIFGTGKTMVSMTGIRLPMLLTDRGFSMPYFVWQLSFYDRLSEPMWWWDAGVSYLPKDSQNEVTLGVQSRPIFNENTSGNLVISDRKLMVVLQYQLRF